MPNYLKTTIGVLLITLKSFIILQLQSYKLAQSSGNCDF